MPVPTPIQVTITVPEIPVELPTASYSDDIAITADTGNPVVNVNMPNLKNTGNAPATLTIDVSGLTDGLTVAKIGTKTDPNAGVFDFTVADSASVLVPVNVSAMVLVVFNVPTGVIGEPDSVLTADVVSSWS